MIRGLSVSSGLSLMHWMLPAELSRKKAANDSCKSNSRNARNCGPKRNLREEVEGDLKDGYEKLYKKQFKIEILKGLHDFGLEPVVQQTVSTAASIGASWGFDLWRRLGGAAPTQLGG